MRPGFFPWNFACCFSVVPKDDDDDMQPVEQSKQRRKRQARQALGCGLTSCMPKRTTNSFRHESSTMTKTVWNCIM